jgi:cell division septation protein DedD
MRADFDEFDDFTENEEKSARTGLPLSWLVLAIALVGFVALAWYAYRAQEGDASSLVLIKAEETPIKLAPQEPGGASFPNQDKTIYEAIAPGAEGDHKKVETLLAAPEEPIAQEESQTKTWVNDTLKKPDTAEAEINDQLAKNEISAREAQVTMAPQEATAPTAPAASPAPPPASPPIVVAPKEAPAEPVLPTPAAQVKAKPALATGAFKIQLGAFKSQAEAENYWKKASAKHAEILGNHSFVILRADLPNGTFYRLRASGFASAEAAKSACTALSAKGQACFYAGK